MVVSRLDYWKAFSRYSIGVIYRSMLSMGVGEVSYFKNDFFTYHSTGGFFFIVAHGTSIDFSAASIAMYISEQWEYSDRHDYTVNKMDDIYGEFQAYTDIIGQWRDKFPRGELGF